MSRTQKNAVELHIVDRAPWHSQRRSLECI